MYRLAGFRRLADEHEWENDEVSHSDDATLTLRRDGGEEMWVHFLYNLT